MSFLFLTLSGQGACQAIESGFALAQVLRYWPDTNLSAALQYFQDLRKPRTDRITSSSYETGKMASADIPEEQWASTFNPDVIRERMRWVMESDLLADLAQTLPLGEVKEETAKGSIETPAVAV